MPSSPPNRPTRSSKKLKRRRLHGLVLLAGAAWVVVVCLGSFVVLGCVCVEKMVDVFVVLFAALRGVWKVHHG